MPPRCKAPVVACVLFLASCDGPQTPREDFDNDYIHTGRISRYYRDHRETGGYFVTMVQRPDEPPWLVVAEPYDFEKSGFTTESSSDSRKVTVDGTTYSPRPGKCIIVLQSEGEVLKRIAEISGSPSLQKLSNGLSAISLEELVAELPSSSSAEPGRAALAT